MARWRLTQSHYLNVPGTEWEYTETDRATGKRGRKIFNVPLLLDIKNAADYNYPESGDIIVCYAGKGERRDIVFEGPPTPDMEPLDAEAEEISESARPEWVHPIESLPGNFSASLISSFEQQMGELIKSQQGRAIPNQAADQSEIKALKEQMASILAENARLQGLALEKEEPKASGRRA